MSRRARKPTAFPLDLTLRVMGEDRGDFVRLVFEIVRVHVPELVEGTITTRSSGGGKYVSAAVSFTAESPEHLDAVVEALARHERVLMVL